MIEFSIDFLLLDSIHGWYVCAILVQRYNKYLEYTRFSCGKGNNVLKTSEIQKGHKKKRRLTLNVNRLLRYG